MPLPLFCLHFLSVCCTRQIEAPPCRKDDDEDPTEVKRNDESIFGSCVIRTRNSQSCQEEASDAVNLFALASASVEAQLTSQFQTNDLGGLIHL